MNFNLLQFQRHICSVGDAVLLKFTVVCVTKVAVGHPSEIDEIFDVISYSKGASVIRMLHNYIGDAVSLCAGSVAQKYAF